MYKKILVPTDGTALSTKVIKEAASLAKLIGSELLLLHVREPHDRPLQTEGSGIISPPKRTEQAHEVKEEQDLLQAAQRVADPMAVKTRTTYVSSPTPHEAIIETAKNSGCDLIVMASHGRRGLAGFLIGSETQKVLAHAAIPVLVVR